VVEWSQAYELALSLGLGLLVGFQRQWVRKRLAGIRTFPLVTLMGTLSVWLADDLGGIVLGASLVALAALVWMGREDAQRDAPEEGITTEVAVLLMFIVGAVVGRGQLGVAVAVSGTVAVLLHWKEPLHDFVRRVGEAETRSVMQVVLIGLVILPALPNRSFGPFLVLNPFQIWSMVVLIVGISVASFLVQRLLGAHVGAILAGVLGGLVSSTATTVSYARRSRASPESVPETALVLILASTVVFPRVLLLASVIAPSVLPGVAVPLLVMFGWMVVLSAATYALTQRRLGRTALSHGPSDLRAAVAFGALYAAVLLGVAASRKWLGDQGLYLVAIVSGLTDVDAIALSTLQFVRDARMEAEIAWRLILAGALSNLVFKAGTALGLGPVALRRWIFVLFGAAIAGGVLLWLVWPDSSA